MLRHLVAIVTLIVITIQCTEAGQIIPIKKGEESPITGYVIDNAQEKKFRQINEESKLLEKKAVTLEQLGELHNQRAEYYKSLYVESQKDLQSKEDRNFWTKTIYFVGGIVVTGFISYAAMKYSK